MLRWPEFIVLALNCAVWGPGLESKVLRGELWCAKRKAGR